MVNNESGIKRIVIDGSQIKCYKDFIDIVQKELDFPSDCEGNVDSYLDWIQDLQWTNYNTVDITITNSEHLSSSNNQDLKYIISDFRDIIIPFWQDEYENCIVEPTQKEIILHLE